MVGDFVKIVTDTNEYDQKLTFTNVEVYQSNRLKKAGCNLKYKHFEPGDVDWKDYLKEHPTQFRFTGYSEYYRGHFGKYFPHGGYIHDFKPYQ